MTLVIVMVCFLLCWSPYIVYSCMLLYMDEKDAVPKFLNPIVSAYILHATMVNSNICFFLFTFTYSLPLNLKLFNIFF